MSEPLRFALLGAGFWAPYQLSGWREVPEAECVAVCDRRPEKAHALAQRFGVQPVYDDAQRLLESEQLDFVDIVTSPHSHHELVLLAAQHGRPAICQKPLADSVEQAVEMIDACRAAGVALLVHENWRWQRPLRALKTAVQEAGLGTIFRGRIQYSNSYPVFENQPFLRQLKRFILTDMGTHILDVSRFLFGEADVLFCHTSRVHRNIQGEDVATVLMRTRDGAAVTCELSYASRLEHDRFPEAFVLMEAERGSAELGPDYWVRVTTEQGTWSRQYPPERYAWASPEHHLVHDSLVACHRNLVDHLLGRGTAETTADDNLKTLELVEAAYESAETQRAVALQDSPSIRTDSR